MNLWDIAVLAMVAAAVVLGIRRAKKSRKCGGTCSCCDGCPKKTE